MEQAWDAIVVGGGPAGLSAALLLGRARRRVLLCDSGEHRNDRAVAMHGFLTRDGIPPGELRRLAREELRAYTGVRVADCRVVEARREESGFVVMLEGEAAPLRSRRLLLATGMVDELPDLPGLNAIWGRTAWHCPYCDGYERRDQPLAVHGEGRLGVKMALEVRSWSHDLVLCTGGSPIDGKDRRRLRELSIGLREERLVALEQEDGELRALRFADGGVLPRRGLFLAAPQRQRCELAERLGCSRTRKGMIRAGHDGGTEVPGLYVAGDTSPHVQLAIVAAAQGSMAAFALNAELLRDDLQAERRPMPA
ncbi:NAD(P)/FAD-dependent oxidoreductase [Roseomonas sp. M0104]|uniref:Thioredoxin reductase n=1 Tax=Teichococcus coralli TaxID=2545983 RepID=A0A845BDZ0_9PROT|nr:NAD(P)/FAD-dependent oxidoreductase [Pseudoroseomonas coralli]MXP65135.1 NAD(P)/FAD-dependent oxidoreductase [Pseudoroseomonas coralli]